MIFVLHPPRAPHLGMLALPCNGSGLPPVTGMTGVGRARGDRSGQFPPDSGSGAPAARGGGGVVAVNSCSIRASR
jgi:hypothetical protein